MNLCMINRTMRLRTAYNQLLPYDSPGDKKRDPLLLDPSNYAEHANEPPVKFDLEFSGVSSLSLFNQLSSKEFVILREPYLNNLGYKDFRYEATFIDRPSGTPGAGDWIAAFGQFRKEVDSVRVVKDSVRTTIYLWEKDRIDALTNSQVSKVVPETVEGIEGNCQKSQ